MTMQETPVTPDPADAADGDGLSAASTEAVERESVPAGTSASSVLPRRESVADLLTRIGDEATGDKLSVGDLVTALEDRAFGFLLLILALPCCIPFLYGVPQAVSLPLVFVAVQIVLGRHKLWLPQTLTKRSFSVASFRDMTQRAVPYLRWFEKISRPRLTFLTAGGIERVLGVFLLAFSASIAVPLPGTNTVPGFAVALMALGFIERDGLLTLAGLVIGTAWVSLLATVGYEALSLAKDWVTGLL